MWISMVILQPLFPIKILWYIGTQLNTQLNLLVTTVVHEYYYKWEKQSKFNINDNEHETNNTDDKIIITNKKTCQ